MNSIPLSTESVGVPTLRSERSTRRPRMGSLICIRNARHRGAAEDASSRRSSNSSEQDLLFEAMVERCGYVSIERSLLLLDELRRRSRRRRRR